MESHPSNSQQSGGAGRKSMLSHLRQEASPSEPGAGSSLHAALAKANQGSGAEGGGEESNPVHPGAASSALPLAMARANDSRGPKPKKPLKAYPPAIQPSVMDLFFHFSRFSDSIRPLKGMLIFLPLFVISATLWVHIPFGPPLPAHPDPSHLLGGDTALLLALLRREVLRGLAVGLTCGLIAQVVFMFAGKGRPPLVWTLKVLVYGLLPVTLLRLIFFSGGWRQDWRSICGGSNPKRTASGF